METTKFNPYDWIRMPEKQLLPVPAAKPKSATGIKSDIELIVSRIESHRLDLTANYQDWLTMGFAFASELGESGRGYFHRVSCYHPDYNYQACNLQFDKCLKRGKSGVSIKSFFFAAKQAGIDIRV